MLLKALQDRTTRGVRLWLDGWAYGERLFAPDGRMPDDRDGRMHCINQLLRLLVADVIDIPLGELVPARAEAAPEQTTRGTTAPARARDALASGEAREGVHALLAGLANTQRAPVALRAPCPREWLERAAQSAGRPGGWDQDDEESVAVYLADHLRSYGDCGVAGLLIDSVESASLTDAGLEMLDPLKNLAMHYRWSIGVRFRAGEAPALTSVAQYFDFVVLPDGGADCGTSGVPIGVTIPEPVWRGAQTESRLDGRACFLFGSVPRDAAPEQVLAALARLRAGGQEGQ
jgi:hypothetical protein